MSPYLDQKDASYRHWQGILDEDRPRYFIIHADPARPIPVSMLTWSRWYEKNHAKKRVKRTVFPWGTTVSTVFLGLDHGFPEITELADKDEHGEYKPVLWESMAFPWYGRRGEDRASDRYTSYDDALRGHKRMVWRALLDDVLEIPRGIWRILSKGTPSQQERASRREMETISKAWKLKEQQKLQEKSKLP